MYSIATPKQIVLVGTEPGPFLEAIHSRFLPNHTVLLIDSDEARQTLGGFMPALKDMTAIEGKTTAYVCENFACQLPTTSVDKMMELLQ
jgi:uncharacterized protein YyaL (SSP411 family)